MGSVVIPIDPGLIATNRDWLQANATVIAPGDVGIVVPDTAKTAQMEPLHVATLLGLKLLARGGVAVQPVGYSISVITRALATAQMPPTYILDALLAASGRSKEEVIDLIDDAVTYFRVNKWDGSPNYFSLTTLEQTADVWRAYASQWPFAPANQPRPTTSRTIEEIQYGRDARSQHTTTPSQECVSIWGPGHVATDIRMVGPQQMWRCVAGSVPSDPNDTPPPPPPPPPKLGPVPDCRNAYGPDWVAVRVSYDGFTEVYECQHVVTAERSPVPTGTPAYVPPEERPIAPPLIQVPDDTDWNSGGIEPGGYPVVIPPDIGDDRMPPTDVYPVPNVTDGAPSPSPVPIPSPGLPPVSGSTLGVIGAVVLGLFFMRKRR